ncbi:hypothetical protein ISCGN_005052 [Ixodes scapularis]
MLLEEVNGTSVGLPGYEHSVNPSIPHKPTRATNSVPAYAGPGAIYIDRSLPQAEIDITTRCTAGQEIVAVRTQLRMRKYVVVSAYYCPQLPRGTRPDRGWMYHPRQNYPKDIILIRGDFNARHLAWGYGTCNLREKLSSTRRRFANCSSSMTRTFRPGTARAGVRMITRLTSLGRLVTPP